eukprot:6467876-Amphidinium_carterae.2
MTVPRRAQVLVDTRSSQRLHGSSFAHTLAQQSMHRYLETSRLVKLSAITPCKSDAFASSVVCLTSLAGPSGALARASGALGASGTRMSVALSGAPTRASGTFHLHTCKS